VTLTDVWWLPMPSRWQSGFLRNESTGALVVSGVAAPGRAINVSDGLALEAVSSQPMVQATSIGVVANTLYWFGAMYVRGLLGDAALDDYYAWESTDHAADADSGVYLRTAPSATGPWSARTLLFRDTDTLGGDVNVQTETPSVLYVPGAARPFYCYYSVAGPDAGDPQFTRLRSSADGRTAWVQESLRTVNSQSSDWANKRLQLSTSGGAAQASEYDTSGWHVGYFDPQWIGSQLVSFSRGNALEPDWGLMWHSYEGLDWLMDPRCMRAHTRVIGDTDHYLAWTQWHPFRWNGQWYTLTTLADGRNLGTVGREMVAVPLAPNLRTAVGAPMSVYTAQYAWELVENVRHVRPFTDVDGTLYFYVTYGTEALANGQYTGVYRMTGD